jgi:hypothetical protein
MSAGAKHWTGSSWQEQEWDDAGGEPQDDEAPDRADARPDDSDTAADDPDIGKIGLRQREEEQPPDRNAVSHERMREQAAREDREALAANVQAHQSADPAVDDPIRGLLVAKRRRKAGRKASRWR